MTTINIGGDVGGDVVVGKKETVQGNKISITGGSTKWRDACIKEVALLEQAGHISSTEQALIEADLDEYQQAMQEDNPDINQVSSIAHRLLSKLIDKIPLGALSIIAAGLPVPSPFNSLIELLRQVESHEEGQRFQAKLARLERMIAQNRQRIDDERTTS